MTKKLFLRLVPLMALAVSMQSCRTNEDLLASKEESYHSNKFQVFTSVNNEPINYANGFRTLLDKYDEMNKTQYSVASLIKSGSFSRGDTEYIELNIHSQDIKLENGDHWVIYPRVKNAAVSGLTVAVLSEYETLVDYKVMDPASDYYAKIINLFRLQYEKSLNLTRQMNKGRGCGFDGSPPCGIDEVIITIPGPGGGNGGGLPGGGGSPSGGCTQYENCFHNDFEGGGGGGNDNPDPLQNQDPCQKTKNIVNNLQAKQSRNTLFDQSKKTGDQAGEKAFMTKADGTPGPIIEGGEHSAQLGDISGYQGYSHNHTPKGIKMFSNRDIYKLFELIVNLPPGAPIGNAFGEMVGTQVCPNCPSGYEYYNYIIRFNGTGQDAGNIYAKSYDFKALSISYEKFERELRNKSGYSSQNGNFISNKGLEEVFYNALDDMGIDKNKINLQKIDKNGKVTTVSLGTDGKPKDTDCPN